MASALTFEQKMVAALEAALMEQIGVTAVNVDGQSITYASRESMIRELAMWKKMVGQQSGKRPFIREVGMGGI